MTVLCAWCGKVLRLGGGVVSHGICDHCSWQVEREIIEGGRGARKAPGNGGRTSRASSPLPGFDEFVP